jgi:hypothetical protein
MTCHRWLYQLLAAQSFLYRKCFTNSIDFQHDIFLGFINIAVLIIHDAFAASFLWLHCCYSFSHVNLECKGYRLSPFLFPTFIGDDPRRWTPNFINVSTHILCKDFRILSIVLRCLIFHALLMFAIANSPLVQVKIALFL